MQRGVPIRASQAGWRSILPSLALAVLGAHWVTPTSFVAARQVDYVIHISVDGLRSDVITILGPTNLPNFFRLRGEGAFTDNARADYLNTETLPNHCTQLAGRGVYGTNGHNWVGNTDPAPGQTLASNKGAYVAGVLDLQARESLSSGSWGNLVTNIVGTGAVVTKVDTTAANLPQRFYRLRLRF